ncbi:MAG: family 20 glycosylhydrolase [Lewinellaceae bacterium]|nr:family 20 glycosylhydrolase [Lewinellaceae bacterium]
MRNLYLPFLTLFFIANIYMSCQTPQEEKASNTYAILPRPAKLEPRQGQCALNADFQVAYSGENPEWEQVAQYLASLLRPATGYEWPVGPQATGAKAIALVEDPAITQPEAYQLSVRPDGITIRAGSPAGAFYGIQSLRQLLPPEIEASSTQSGISWAAPCVEIADEPRFAYRGMHLDVGRHFFPPEFVKRYIGLLAKHKMNRFHWHLTEDQGWRIEIKRYPKLQEIAAYRKETLVGHYSSQPRRYDGQRYGGYYTQEEVKDIVAYARSRFVTIIPEIEMPGHSLAALSAYPELGCTRGPYEAATHWGVFEDVYCTKDTTFHFLENVLAEVIALFPSHDIHIGGDECPKVRWKNCPDCQRRMQEEGLKNEHELQSYFIGRMESYLNAQGRDIIGWDEILEGGLAPNATVMSWRGTEGGIAAARQGHDVIMTPTSYCYLDYYQSMSEDEPLAIGGYLPLSQVYGYEPIPEELSPEEARHILGVQGNLWTEYIPDGPKAEYMAYPRAIALAEVAWSPKAGRDYEDFVHRLSHYSRHLDEMGVQYSNEAFGVRIATAPAEGGGVQISLSTLKEGAAIHYTLDGAAPNAQSSTYSGPISLNADGTLLAATFDDGERASPVLRQEVVAHRAVGKAISLAYPPHSDYRHLPASVLVNGLPASETRFKDGEWLAWQEQPMEATVDLGESQQLRSVSLHFFNDPGVWIHPPSAVSLSFSDDGEHFRQVENAQETISSGAGERTQIRAFTTAGARARYIRITAQPYGIIPDGVPGAGHPAWLFVGELIVR